MHTSLLNSLPPSSAAPNVELALTLLGPSASMSQLWSQIRRLAPHIRTVLLTGPADSGQQAVARLLLDLSPHPRREFVVIPALEAEDRFQRLQGPSAIPHDAFVFLPHVDQLSTTAQAGLLKLLRMRRLGYFSVVASTSEDLRTLVSVGRFSAELADILAAVRMAIPALSERIEDVPMLLTQTLALRCQSRQVATPQLSEALLRLAMEHHWPGNLAELTAVADDLVLRAADNHLDVLGPDHLRTALAMEHASKDGSAPVRMVKLDTVVQEHIYAVLRGCRGNKLRAAEVLGISRSTLYRMLDTSGQNASFQIAC
jgi:DNA-binding NtrC family response regulator